MTTGTTTWVEVMFTQSYYSPTAGSGVGSGSIGLGGIGKTGRVGAKGSGIESSGAVRMGREILEGLVIVLVVMGVAVCAGPMLW